MAEDPGFSPLVDLNFFTPHKHVWIWVLCTWLALVLLFLTSEATEKKGGPISWVSMSLSSISI